MELKRKAEEQALVPVAKRSKAELIAYGGSNKALVEGVSMGDNKRSYHSSSVLPQVTSKLAVISQLYLASFEIHLIAQMPTNKESYCVWANRGLEQGYFQIKDFQQMK